MGDKMADDELKLETKCYDANEYGYLYGLNKKIPDEEFSNIVATAFGENNEASNY